MSAGSAGSATFGDLTVLRELGRGGMGVVYLAQGSGGEQVALKTLAVDDERLSGSIRREIAALSRLDHPGIARIVAHGANAQTPWYAMAFERGVTLRSWQSVRVRRLFSAGERTVAGPGPTGCDEVTAMGMTMMADTSAVTGGSATSAATHAAPADAPWISRCLALLRKLCAPLAYLHGEGFVHRDLKPENVVVRSDGSPVVVDFGLATEWTARELREDVDRAADPSGTAIYMAPEQWLGGLVDARTDLYALGCIAYELLTGRPPFHGGSAADLARQHLGATPLPPSALAPAVEKRLDDLVLALLSKRPRDRVGHADTVAERLEALGADGGATAPAPRPRAYLYRADLLGRDDVVARIGSRMKTIGQRGGLLLLRGASGVGKTRLLLHAMELARRLRVPSFTGRCETTGSPLHPLSGFLDRASARCREVGDEETDRVFAGAAPVLAPFASGIARLDGAARELEPLPAPMARLRVFRELGGVLERVARGRPMLVVLDDLQWADELTLAFLESLAFSGRLGSMPVLLAGTVRSEEEPAIVARIARHADCCSVDLEGLGAADVASLVSEMLSDPRPPAALSDLLVRSCAGNPFFVAEALRAAVLGGQLARDGSGRWILADAPLSLAGIERLALPEAMREVVRRRIASLPQSARRVLESAAVLGVECEAEVLRICTGERDDAFAEALWELARRQLLLERQPGILRFDHDKIREAALGAVAPRDLAGLHRAAAHAIASRRGDDPAAQADLGLHWRDAGEPALARPCLLSAARRAGEAGAVGDADELYVSYLALVETPTTESVIARRELGTLRFLSQGIAAREIVEQALAEARGLADRSVLASCLGLLGSVLRTEGMPERGEEHLVETLAIYRELSDRRGEARALRVLGALRARHGHTQGEPLMREALAIHRELGDAPGECVALTDLAVLLASSSALPEAEELGRTAVALARAGGSRMALALALGAHGACLSGLGRIAEARADFEECLEASRAVGDRQTEAAYMLSLASTYPDAPATARGVLTGAIAIIREIGDRFGEMSALRELAQADLDLGRVEEARAGLARCIAMAREIGSRRDEAWALLALAEVERLAFDADAAERTLLDGAALMEQVGEETGLLRYAIARGHHELRRGRDPEGIVQRARVETRRLGVAIFEPALERLVAARDAQLRGAVLHRGELLDRLPADLRQALAGLAAEAP